MTSRRVWLTPEAMGMWVNSYNRRRNPSGGWEYRLSVEDEVRAELATAHEALAQTRSMVSGRCGCCFKRFAVEYLRLGVCGACLAHQTCSSCERPYRRHNWAWGGLCSGCVERYRARYLEQDDPKAPFETEWMRSIYPDVLRALEGNRTCPNRQR